MLLIYLDRGCGVYLIYRSSWSGRFVLVYLALQNGLVFESKNFFLSLVGNFLKQFIWFVYRLSFREHIHITLLEMSYLLTQLAMAFFSRHMVLAYG